MVHNLLKNHLLSEVNDYSRLFKSLISIEQNILINHDRDFVKKIKEFINSSYDPNNLSIENAERLLNKNISFYLNEKKFYHFFGPEDKETNYEEQFTFKEIKEKIGNMNEYKIYLDVLDGNCKYIIRLKKYDYYHSEEWEFKVYDNKIISLNLINVYD